MKTHPALAGALRQLLGKESPPIKSQTRALGDLFELFTRARQDIGMSYLDDPKLRRAYLQYHVPRNSARSLCVLQDVLGVYPDLHGVQHVVDLGAGPGSSSLAALCALDRSTERSFVLTDKSTRALRLARELINTTAASLSIERPEVDIRTQRLPTVPHIPPRSLVWLSMVLNELATQGREGGSIWRVLDTLDRKMPAGSLLMIVEPALRAEGLRLLEVRERLLATGNWRVLAPCTHAAACPLLEESGRPWCHFHVDWHMDAATRKIAAPLGLDRERLSLSYLALLRVGEPVNETRRAAAGIARAIGDPFEIRGGARGIYICEDGDRRELTPVPRGLERGDRVETQGERAKVLDPSWPGKPPPPRGNRQSQKPRGVREKTPTSKPRRKTREKNERRAAGGQPSGEDSRES